MYTQCTLTKVQRLDFVFLSIYLIKFIIFAGEINEHSLSRNIYVYLVTTNLPFWFIFYGHQHN